MDVCCAVLQEDKKVKDRIDSRNGLEGYCYNLKNMLEDDEKVRCCLAHYAP